MDPIVFKQNFARWNKTCSYLIAHRAELTDVEIRAIDILLNYWENHSFSTAMVQECTRAVDDLKSQHKYHSNNKDIITNSKDFCAVAIAFYTRDETTYNQFRTEMRKLNISQSAPSARPTPMQQPSSGSSQRSTPSSSSTSWSRNSSQSSAAQRFSQPSQTMVANVLIKQDVVKWRDAIQYLVNNRAQLTDEESDAVSDIEAIFNNGWTQNSISTARRAVATISSCDKFHGNNRMIIEHMKNIKLIAQRYIIDGNVSICSAFFTALKEYLNSNPVKIPNYQRQQPRPQQYASSGSGGYSAPQYYSRSKWEAFDEFTLNIGNWFAEHYDTVPDFISGISYYLVWGLFIIGCIVTFFKEGFWTTLFVGIIGGIICAIASAIILFVINLILKAIFFVLRFLFYRGWTLVAAVIGIVALVIYNNM